LGGLEGVPFRKLLVHLLIPLRKLSLALGNRGKIEEAYNAGNFRGMAVACMSDQTSLLNREYDGSQVQARESNTEGKTGFVTPDGGIGIDSGIRQFLGRGSFSEYDAVPGVYAGICEWNDPVARLWK
jgi:hypothetical protein